MTSIVDVYRRWPTKEACIEHLEQKRNEWIAALRASL